MHVLIGGGSGFIGKALTQALEARGDQVTIISRFSGPRRITWDDLKAQGLGACGARVDAVVNLAGEHILNLSKRWNEAYMNEVIRSRVETTESLVAAMNESATPPEVFVSTAGKCFYGTQELDAKATYPDLTEDSEPMGIDFPAELVGKWEKAAEGVDTSRIRHCKLRIGIVLGSVERKSYLGKLWRIGRSRGLLPIIRLPFCVGLGASIGQGTQPFPWIHIDDMVGILLHAIDRKDISGRFNAVSPGIVTNRAFTESFAKALRRPIRWSIPAWLVRAIVSEQRASILLQGQKVIPKRTLEAGYVFKFPDIDTAMKDLVKIVF